MPTEFAGRLAAAHAGDAAAFSEAYAAAYQELRRIARRQLRSMARGDVLVTTALVHEAYLKLVGHAGGAKDHEHFLALAARAMRQILVDHARARASQKRGGAWRQTTLDEAAIPVDVIADEMLAIDTALSRLEAVDERLARLVEWRFFAGMTDEEIAAARQVTTRTVRRDWQKARAFLYRELTTSHK